MTASPAALPDFLVEVDGAARGVRDLEGARACLDDLREEVRAGVAEGRGFVFRGFPVEDVGAFRSLIERLNPELIPYSGAKVRLGDDAELRLYTPTSVPPHRKNFLHNEVAYQRDVPSALTVYCHRPATRGGETLLADQREVFRALPEDLQRRFVRRRLRFQRYLQDETALQRFLSSRFDSFALLTSWQGNFGSDDRAAVEAECEAGGFEVEWRPDGGLMLTCVVDPCRPHPVDGEPMWCNNSHLFQVDAAVYGWPMATAARAFLAATGRPPTICTYGDGEPFEPAVIRAILDATERCEATLPLRAGDFVYLNNHAIGHGRTVFSGPRRLYFGIFA